MPYTLAEMAYSIRRGLLSVAGLGALTCALSLYVLGRPIMMANANRVERSHDGVEHEVERLRTPPGGVDAHPSSNMYGMRSGYITAGQSFGDMSPPLPEGVPDALHDAVDEASSSQRQVAIDRGVGAQVVFVGAAPLAEHRFAWAVYVMQPPRWTPMLRLVGLLIAIASFALVLAAVHAVFSVRRGAAALQTTLSELARDLRGPVARPAVKELADVARGIERLAGELAQAQDALAERERLAVLGRVTAGLAHELRNPLAAIKLRVDMAAKNRDVPTDVVSDLADAGAEVARLDRLVSDLLTVAGGRRTGPRTEVDFGTFARRRASLMLAFAEERSVRVEVMGEATAVVDGDAIARVIDNLLRNAIESSPRDAVVRLEADSRNGPRLRVSDLGSGVPEDRRSELFEPFFTTKPEGVGLGLALSRAICVAHGGTLTYRREGEASVFEVTIPEATS